MNQGGRAEKEDVSDADEAQGSCLGAGCSNRYCPTKVLPATLLGLWGQVAFLPPTVHAHLLDLLHSRVFCPPLNPYITISSFLLPLSISPAQEQKASLISSASLPF